MKIFVRVKTGIKKENIKQISSNNFSVSVSARPEKGKANEAVLKIITEYFNVPLRKVKIHSGHISKEKIIEVSK